MTQDEIIAMARQVGYPIQHSEWQKATEEFAALVAEKATEEANARANASWTLMCEKMVALEREACAKVCDELSDKHTWEGCYAAECAGAIRARGDA
jgi:hypothetical protein